MFSRKLIGASAFCALALLPHTALASIIINEIAWMGTTVSGTNEWIELANISSDTVDLSGWSIDAEDGSPNIALSGTISPNGFFLIERTDDTTVPDVTADLIAPFGNGLGNSGETLRLKDGSGAIVDTVIGGVDWKNIGGDNVTKETPQKSGNSWVNGTPTPRALNVSSGSVLGASVTTTTSTVTNTSADAVSNSTTSSDSPAVTRARYSASVYPRDTMTVAAGRDMQTFTGLPLEFSGNAFGLYDEVLPYATYRWNFGDGATGEGKTATHTYRFPGEYTVTLHVYNASLEVSDRLVVNVTDPTIVIARTRGGEDGFIELQNQSDREVDISGWVLHTSPQYFSFPEHTVISAKKTTIFPNSVTHLDPALFAPTLAFANGTRVEDTPQATPTARTTGVPKTTTPVPVSIVSSQTTQMSNVAKPPRDGTREDESERSVMSDATSTSVAAATILWERSAEKPIGVLDATFGGGGLQWFFVLMGLLLLVLAGVILARSRVDIPSEADEYAIVSDIIEGGEEGMQMTGKY